MDTGGGDDYYSVTKVERELIEMVEKEKEQKTMLKRLQGLSHCRWSLIFIYKWKRPSYVWVRISTLGRALYQAGKRDEKGPKPLYRTEDRDLSIVTICWFSLFNISAHFWHHYLIWKNTLPQCCSIETVNKYTLSSHQRVRIWFKLLVITVSFSGIWDLNLVTEAG